MACVAFIIAMCALTLHLQTSDCNPFDFSGNLRENQLLPKSVTQNHVAQFPHNFESKAILENLDNCIALYIHLRSPLIFVIQNICLKNLWTPAKRKSSMINRRKGTEDKLLLRFMQFYCFLPKIQYPAVEVLCTIPQWTSWAFINSVEYKLKKKKANKTVKYWKMFFMSHEEIWDLTSKSGIKHWNVRGKTTSDSFQ